MPEFTINLNSCGCGCGAPPPAAGPGAAATSEPPIEWGPPSGLDDRQCKMAVWLFSWFDELLDLMGNSTTGQLFLSIYNFTSSDFTWMVPILTTIIASGLSAILTGPDPSDAVVGIFAGWVAAAIGLAWSGLDAAFISQPQFQLVHQLVINNRDLIICRLSTATNALEAEQIMGDALSDIGISGAYETLITPLLPGSMYNFLFFTADFWPSFDIDELSGITEGCCGFYEQGQPVIQATDLKCTAVNFILDTLADLFKQAGETGYGFGFDWNPFNNNQDLYYDRLLSTLEPDSTAKDLVNYNDFVKHLSSHLYASFGLLQDFYGLSEYYLDLPLLGIQPDTMHGFVTGQRQSLACLLYDATTMDDAYSGLHDELSSQADGLSSDPDLNTIMRAAFDALIDPSQSDLLYTLFIQDTRLSGWPITTTCGPCSATNPLVDCIQMNIGSIANVYGNAIRFAAQDVSGDIRITLCEDKQVTLLNKVGTIREIQIRDGGQGGTKIYDSDTDGGDFFAEICGDYIDIDGFESNGPLEFVTILFDECGAPQFLAIYDFETGWQGTMGKRAFRKLEGNPGDDSGLGWYSALPSDCIFLSAYNFLGGGTAYLDISKANILAQYGATSGTLLVDSVTLDVYQSGVHPATELEVQFISNTGNVASAVVANTDLLTEHNDLDVLFTNPSPSVELGTIRIVQRVAAGGIDERELSYIDNVRVTGSIT